MAINIGSLINGLLSFLIVIASLVLSIGLSLGILCGIVSVIISLFLDSEQKDKFVNFGKKAFLIALKSFIGLIIMAFVYAILMIVLNFLGFQSM